METGLRLNLEDILVALETSLVEWKRDPTAALLGALATLETSLVEWKRLRDARLKRDEIHLGNFLSGMETIA